jgi:replication factor C small subunit
MLWTEKYRPTRLAQIVGQESFKLDAENWVLLKDMPNLLLYGPAGTGKTASAYVLGYEILGKNMKSNFYEINASDDRKLDVIRGKIKDIVSHATIGDVPFKIIFLDEMEGMTSDAQNALKRIMERYSDHVRFIFTSNDRSKIVYPLQSRCANYYFNTVSNEAIMNVVEYILKQENKKIPPNEDLQAFIGAYNGDIRRVIVELQAALHSNTSLKVQINKSLDDYQSILELIIDEKLDSALEKMFEEIYSGKTMKNICIGLHDVIVNGEMETRRKYKLLGVIGETEWRSQTMTPRVLASWMIAQTK